MLDPIHHNKNRDTIDTKFVFPNRDYNPVKADQNFSAIAPYLPSKLLSEVPWTSFVYSTQHIDMPKQVHKSISWMISEHESRQREYQELMDTYFHVTVDRLADISPCYMDIWRSYIPSMAFGPKGSPALLNAIVALSSLHIAPLQTDHEKGRLRAMGFYYTARRLHGDSGDLLEQQLGGAVLATALIFAHFEVYIVAVITENSCGMGKS